MLCAWCCGRSWGNGQPWKARLWIHRVRVPEREGSEWGRRVWGVSSLYSPVVAPRTALGHGRYPWGRHVLSKKGSVLYLFLKMSLLYALSYLLRLTVILHLVLLFSIPSVPQLLFFKNLLLPIFLEWQTIKYVWNVSKIRVIRLWIKARGTLLWIKCIHFNISIL